MPQEKATFPGVYGVEVTETKNPPSGQAAGVICRNRTEAPRCSSFKALGLLSGIQSLQQVEGPLRMSTELSSRAAGVQGSQSGDEERCMKY